MILQFAAALTRVSQFSSQEARNAFLQGGFPLLALILIWMDNTATKYWTNHVATTSPMGQALIPIFAELLQYQHLGVNCDHIPGKSNDKADFISRPPTNHLSLPATVVNRSSTRC